MKFLTYEWWASCQGGPVLPDPEPAYREHLQSIRHLLPRDILQLEGCTLHDGTLDNWMFDAGQLALTLRIHGDRHWDARAFTLHYNDVQSFRSFAGDREGLVGPGGFGHLGYDEFDINDGLPVHRFLFSSGIEFEIVFGAFSIEIESLPPPPDDEDA